MKKLLAFAILSIASVSLLLDSCSKEPVQFNEESVPKSLIDEAKNWHYEQTHTPGIWNGRVSNEKRLILTPKFSQAKLKTFANGRKFLYTPAMDFKLKKSKFSMLRGFVFEIRGERIISGKIVEIYGSVDFITSHKSELLTKYVDKQLGDFTGSIITYNVNYHYIYGFVYNNGKRIGAQSALGYKITGDDKQISSGRAMDGQLIDVYLVVYYSDGSSDWNYMYSYCSGCGSGGESPGGGTGPGSDPNYNGGAGDPVALDYVYDLVLQPCISQQIENALSADVVNGISGLVQKYFNVNGNYNVVFTQSTELGDTVDAQVLPHDVNGILDLDITFNANTLPNASQEYIMATVYHEFLHAILIYYGFTPDQEHEAMADSYVTDLANALKESFPNLSDADATNLAWGGLEGTAAYNNLSEAQKAAIADINNKYFTRQLGTSCN